VVQCTTPALPSSLTLTPAFNTGLHLEEGQLGD
jgi:hypothetical protein